MLPEEIIKPDPFALPVFRPPLTRQEGGFRRQQCVTDYAVYALQSYDIDSLLKKTIASCENGLGIDRNYKFLVHAHLNMTSAKIEKTGEQPDSLTEFGLLGDHAPLKHDLLTTSWQDKKIITARVSGKAGILGYLIATTGKDIEASPEDVAFFQTMATIFAAAVEKISNEAALIKQLQKAEETKKHQEILTQEISHRVKNSFHLLGGLLIIQSRNIANEEARQALEETITRIYTIAQVYDELWRYNDVQTLNLKVFLKNLRKVLHATAPNHSLIGEISPITVKADQAITIALLCNELITNAIKYAYPNGMGRILVSIAKVMNTNTLKLEVRDYGVGLPENFSVTEKSGLGLKLTQSLSRQLGGIPKWEQAHPGTRFVLEFPL